MILRSLLICVSGLVATTQAVPAQESPGKRLAGMVAVATTEYRLGVSESGGVMSQMELDEARAFLADARSVAARVIGDSASRIRALVDSLADAAVRRVPPAELDALHTRLETALGPDAALDLPTRAIDPHRGGALYARHCASCHGAAGRGDGPAGAGLDPAPPAFADRAMHDVTPTLMYRIASVGVQGTAMAAWASVLSPDDRWNVIEYIHTLRFRADDAERGAQTLASRCPACANQPGDSLRDYAWLAGRSDSEIASVVRARIVSNSAGGRHASWSDDDALAVVAALRTDAARLVGARNAVDAASVRAIVLSRLDSALALTAAGTQGAADLAFDAYAAFEPLENRVRARHPALVSRVERDFLAFRGAIAAGDVRGARSSLEQIRLGLASVADAAREPVRGWSAFLQSLVIMLREGFEAILIVGAMITLLVRTGNASRVRDIWVGVAVALAASALTAVILRTVLDALPATREVIEGSTMLVAVAVLFSVSYWILSRVESRRWQAYIRDQVNAAVTRGGRVALQGVAFLVVYREGAETVLFYEALMRAGGNAVVTPVAAGFIAGIAGLAVVVWVFRVFGLRVPLRSFFAVTGGLLYLMAFAFMGNGLRELQEGGALPITPVPGPVIDVLGVYPTLETLGGQGVLLALFLVACWRSFVAPVIRAPAPSEA